MLQVLITRLHNVFYRFELVNIYIVVISLGATMIAIKVAQFSYGNSLIVNTVYIL